MPSLFVVCGYRIYFWSNENNEPVHVHVSKGKPFANATKIWITSQGGCILASNGSNIPKQTLNELMDIISAQSESICESWKKHFLLDKIAFYC